MCGLVAVFVCDEQNKKTSNGKGLIESVLMLVSVFEINIVIVKLYNECHLVIAFKADLLRRRVVALNESVVQRDDNDKYYETLNDFVLAQSK